MWRIVTSTVLDKSKGKKFTYHNKVLRTFCFLQFQCSYLTSENDDYVVCIKVSHYDSLTLNTNFSCYISIVWNVLVHYLLMKHVLCLYLFVNLHSTFSMVIPETQNLRTDFHVSVISHLIRLYTFSSVIYKAIMSLLLSHSMLESAKE